jgi:tagatose 6-phosphate kinase
MILCLGTTPAVQRVLVFRKLTLDAVNRAHTTLEGASGKSINVAKVLHSLGERPFATGFLGGDRGEFIRQALDKQGIAHGFVTVAARTRVCLTAIDESAGTHTELVEESSPAATGDFAALLNLVHRRIASCQAVVMSGTLAPGAPPDLYGQITRLARTAGVLAVVDAQGSALTEALAAEPDLVKPNRTELAATVGQSLSDEPAVCAAMRELHARGARRVVVTAGPQTVLAYDGRQSWKISPTRVTAANPIGSGDAFTAGLVSRLVHGDELGEACRWGAAVGAANALTLMPGEVNRGDVERLLPETSVSPVTP